MKLSLMFSADITKALLEELDFEDSEPLPPIDHHIGNHAIMTIARRRKKALGMALQKN